MGVGEERNRGRHIRTADPRFMLSRRERERERERREREEREREKRERGEREKRERERREKLTAQNSWEEFRSELKKHT